MYFDPTNLKTWLRAWRHKLGGGAENGSCLRRWNGLRRPWAQAISNALISTASL